MKRHIHQRNAQRGFTLVEVMVAFTVLAFGLLTVAGFQSKLVSGSSLNKARSEAVALAQQKLDQIRSYTDEATLVGNLEGRAPVAGETFPADVSDGDYPDDGAGNVDPEPLQGINADFERQWSVAVAGDVADVAVTVSWEDPRHGTQSVSLGTAITWKNPRGGAVLSEASDPAVPSATGRAHLGEGDVAVSAVTSGDNGDGTATGDFDGDGDLELVDLTSTETVDGEERARVVLTLKGACNTESGVCTDFVRIHGRVYVDTTTSSTALSDTFVLASDAAFCSRDLDDATSTPNGDYNYYDYTCYLGGGWHGNIGLLLNVNNADVTACVGDPDATVAGWDAWKRVELVRRRVYRGVTNKFTDSASGVPVQDIWGNTLYYAVTDAGGDVLHYSQGIADAVEFPNDYTYRTGGHDFVLIGGNKPTAADCLPALARTDAVDASLFSDVPGDFVCLNNDDTPNNYTDGVNPNSYNKFLDNFKEDVFRAPNDCPYDPSDPPSYRYEISGDISTDGTTPDSMQVVTSDGTENCRWTITGGTTSYECDIYVREDADGNLNGWNGTITVKPAANFLCAPPEDHPVDETTVYTNPAEQYYPDELSGISGEDYTCLTLATPQVTGTISAPGSDLRGATIEVDDPTAECTFTPPGDSAIVTAAGPVSEATFTCKLIEPSVGAGWSGTITFVPPEGMPADACNATEWTWTDPTLKVSTEALAPDSDGDGNPDALECRVPQHAWLVGELSVVAPLTQETLLDTLLINAQGCSSCSCTIDATASPLSYTCNLSYYGVDGWYGDISVVPGNPDVACEPAVTTLSGVTGSDVSPYSGPTISCEQDLSGPVVISGNITVYDLARTTPNTPSITGGGTCTLNNGAAVPLSGTYKAIPYSCTTPVIDEGMTWSGTITFSDNGAKTYCYGNPGEYTDLDPRAVVEGQNVLIEKNAASCP